MMDDDDDDGMTMMRRDGTGWMDGWMESVSMSDGSDGMTTMVVTTTRDSKQQPANELTTAGPDERPDDDSARYAGLT